MRGCRGLSPLPFGIASGAREGAPGFELSQKRYGVLTLRLRQPKRYWQQLKGAD